MHFIHTIVYIFHQFYLCIKKLNNFKNSGETCLYILKLTRLKYDDLIQHLTKLMNETHSSELSVKLKQFNKLMNKLVKREVVYIEAWCYVGVKPHDTRLTFISNNPLDVYIKRRTHAFV